MWSASGLGLWRSHPAPGQGQSLHLAVGLESVDLLEDMTRSCPRHLFPLDHSHHKHGALIIYSIFKKTPH